jgi:23S rRNA G2069 N7-methylase RlmK/C1962 C5-methylase RlmI
VLNLFCYTGAFSVYAAKGDAANIDSVDLSNSYLDWAKENFLLNELDSKNLIRADALKFIDNAVLQKRKYDIIILDPPVFSNSKKMDTYLDLQKSNAALVSKCILLLDSGGKLFFSAKSRSFNDDDAGAICNEHDNIVIKNITEQTRTEDFKDKKIPTWYLAHRTQKVIKDAAQSYL